MTYGSHSIDVKDHLVVGGSVRVVYYVLDFDDPDFVLAVEVENDLDHRVMPSFGGQSLSSCGIA